MSDKVEEIKKKYHIYCDKSYYPDCAKCPYVYQCNIATEEEIITELADHYEQRLAEKDKEIEGMKFRNGSLLFKIKSLEEELVKRPYFGTERK